MTRACTLLLLLILVVPLGGQRGPVVSVAVRSFDGQRSLLIELLEPPGQPVDEVRIELPRGMAEAVVLLTGPPGWTTERDGRWIRLIGDAAPAPFRARLALFDTADPGRVRVRARAGTRTLWDQTVATATLPALSRAGSVAGLIQIPSVVSPGDTLELEVLNPSRTPPEGQWVVAGVTAMPADDGRLRVRLPDDLLPGAPLRVSYFDRFGDRLVDALSVDEVVVSAAGAEAAAPRITGCAGYGFVGQSLCVCGDFPGASWRGLTVGGEPATVVAASRHAVQIRLPQTLPPGAHVIAGDPAAGFAAADTVTTRALALRASIDTAALLRGQSTMMRVAIEGAAAPVTLVVVNRTPHVIGIPGGNYQEIELPPDAAGPVERRVDARSVGDFVIDTRVLQPPCPCVEEARGDHPSPASRDQPLFVPRRVLITMAPGTPVAMTAAAQALAAANGLAVVDVSPIALTNDALVTFEILDGLDPVAKAAQLAAVPTVIAAQPDFVYDTFQSDAPALPAYGLEMIGADRTRSVARGDGVRIAVIDTGIDTGHTRLQSRLADYADVTGTGWTPDVHGTLVAGVIAAEADEETLAGVAPGAAIVAVKACIAQSPTRAAARCWSSTLARGIDAAARQNVRVMNLSVGGKEDPLLARMVDSAASRGIVMIAAAGNDGPQGHPSYPAAMDSVIAVTAVDAAGRLYQQSTRGPFIDVAAPGVDILSTGPGGRTQLFTGTSAATAFASGAAALLLQQQSSLTASDLRTLLRSTARRVGSAPETEVGAGVLDVCRAMVQASPAARITCR